MADESETPYGGEFPDVRDEAAASPKWLPGLGFAILCLFALFLALRATTAHDEADAGDQAEEVTAEAPAEGGEEAPAPEQPPIQ
jgi:hypothetical protein